MKLINSVIRRVYFFSTENLFSGVQAYFEHPAADKWSKGTTGTELSTGKWQSPITWLLTLGLPSHNSGLLWRVNYFPKCAHLHPSSPCLECITLKQWKRCLDFTPSFLLSFGFLRSGSESSQLRKKVLFMKACCRVADDFGCKTALIRTFTLG